MEKSLTTNFTSIDNSNERAPVAIFVHGGPGLSHHYFLPLMKSVSSVATTIGYDQGTIKLDAAPSVTQLADELRYLIQTKCFGRNVVLIAHSFGSIIALEYARKFDLGVPLVLISWIYDNSWINIFNSRNSKTEFYFQKLASLNEGITDLSLRSKNRMKVFSDLYFPNESAMGVEVFENLNYYPEITAAIEPDWFKKIDSKAALETLRGPTLSLAGTADQVVFPEYIAAASMLNSKIKHHEIPGGHFPFLNDNGLVSEYIADFFEYLNF